MVYIGSFDEISQFVYTSFFMFDETLNNYCRIQCTRVELSTSCYICLTRYFLSEFLFVCWFGVYRPTREFFTHMETSPCRWRTANYLWHTWPLSSEGSLTFHTCCDTGLLLRGPVTITPVAERLAVELSLHFSRLRSVATGNRTRSPACESNALTLRHRGGCLIVTVALFLAFPT